MLTIQGFDLLNLDSNETIRGMLLSSENVILIFSEFVTSYRYVF